MKALTIAVMTEANEMRGAEQIGSQFFMGDLIDVGCLFTKTTDTFCIRTSNFYTNKEDALNSPPLNHVVVEKGPLVLDDGKLKYNPSIGCLSPINQWAIETQFNRRLINE